MTKILTPEDILQDELDPRILLKVEKLRGPVAWDYDSLAENNDGTSSHNHHLVMLKSFKYSLRFINPFGRDTVTFLYRSIYNANNMHSDDENEYNIKLSRYGHCLIGIKALRPVKFSISVTNYVNPITVISMNTGEYQDNLIAGYPIPLRSIPYVIVWATFSQGSVNDIECVYSNLYGPYRDKLREDIILPYDNPVDRYNKYNILINYGLLGIANQSETNEYISKSRKRIANHQK